MTGRDSPANTMSFMVILEFMLVQCVRHGFKNLSQQLTHSVRGFTQPETHVQELFLFHKSRNTNASFSFDAEMQSYSCHSEVDYFPSPEVFFLFRPQQFASDSNSLIYY